MSAARLQHDYRRLSCTKNAHASRTAASGLDSVLAPEDPLLVVSNGLPPPLPSLVYCELSLDALFDAAALVDAAVGGLDVSTSSPPLELEDAADVASVNVDPVVVVVSTMLEPAVEVPLNVGVTLVKLVYVLVLAATTTVEVAEGELAAEVLLEMVDCNVELISASVVVAAAVLVAWAVLCAAVVPAAAALIDDQTEAVRLHMLCGPPLARYATMMFSPSIP